MDEWCDEASFVDGEQSSSALPDWQAASISSSTGSR